MHHAPHLRAVIDPAIVLAPGDFRRIPVEILHREAVVDADKGPLDAGEEAPDVIGVHAIPGLVFLAVVYALELLQALEIVIAEVLVGMDRRPVADMLSGELPRLVAVLGSNDASESAFSPEERLLAHGKDRHAFEILILFLSPIDPVLLPVLLLDVSASILSVDVDLAFENDVFAPGGDRLAHLHQEHPGGLVLATEFAGELEGALALHAVHGQPQSRQNVSKGHLPEGKDRLRGDREFATALLAFETLPSDRIAALVSAVDAHGTSTCLGPADQAERLEGIFLGDLAEGLKREGPAVR